MEEFGAADQSVASVWNAHSMIAVLPLATFGTDHQEERWLRPLTAGEAIGAFGLTEPTADSNARVSGPGRCALKAAGSSTAPRRSSAQAPK
ncbi:acyl-CoA dehydrogenase family protein [Amycolatopsis benzoatilytica]|uniref:acyl-CoA dehydrogenase family protein n=1 Tax=Amycolatopsis benzoatilytica TaxID=346045 RepID=UPI001FDED102|nr:acyl-CoA dehydrogenase family protein [Amycolatopsis benzoatilytica]